MYNRYILVLLSFIVIGSVSCSRSEDLGDSNITIPSSERKDLDKWLFDNFTKPLNIEVKYLWDDSELDLNKKLVPSEKEKVQPFMEVVKRVWIDPYTDPTVVPDESFLKSLCPKQIVLVGSLSYNSDGTVTLGTAEGGRKIVLYEVNNFDKMNKEQVIRMLHTMQHEFAHILHQNKMYTPDFKKITPNYTTTWSNFSDEESNDAGFITSYARSSADEDFVEMVAALLTMSKSEYNRKIDRIVSAEGRTLIRKKEAIVVAYFRDKYNIDIYKLQQRIVDAMKSLNEAPAGSKASFSFRSF